VSRFAWNRCARHLNLFKPAPQSRPGERGRQDIRGEDPKLLVLLFHAVQFAGPEWLTAFHYASG
jgi:hypothetical protein